MIYRLDLLTNATCLAAKYSPAPDLQRSFCCIHAQEGYRFWVGSLEAVQVALEITHQETPGHPDYTQR
jgi:hypothetical protein